MLARSKSEGEFRAGHGGHVKPSARLAQALARRGDLKRIHTSKGAVRVDALPELELLQTVACAIRIGTDIVGTVWITEGDMALTEVDLRAAEHAALVAALLIAHQRELRLEEKRLGYTFFDSLIEGQIEDLPAAIERAKLMAFEPDSEYRFCIYLMNVPAPLNKSDFQKREHAAELIREHLKKEAGGEMLSVRSNMVKFLAGADVDLQKLLHRLAPIGGGIGASRTYVGLEHIKDAWIETREIIPYIKPKGIYFADQMLLQMVISGDKRAQKDLVQQTYGRLKDHAKGDLAWTMQMLCKHDFHLARTAEELGIHLGTLRYRMGKLEEMLEMDFGDTECRLKLHLACRLLADSPED